MNDRIKVLKQRVGESDYAVDEHAVADAILIRTSTMQLLPRLEFLGAAGHGPARPSRRGHLRRSPHRAD